MISSATPGGSFADSAPNPLPPPARAPLPPPHAPSSQLFTCKRVEVVQEVEGERLQGVLRWLVDAVQELKAREPEAVELPPDHTEEIERLKARAGALEASAEELRAGVERADTRAGAAAEAAAEAGVKAEAADAKAEAADAKAEAADAKAEAADARVTREAERLDAEVGALREAQARAEEATALLSERVQAKAEQADLDETRGDLADGLARVDAAEAEIIKLWEAIRDCEARLDGIVIPEPLPPLPPVEIPLPPAGDTEGVDFGALLRPLQEAIACNRQALESLGPLPARVERAETGLGRLEKRVATLEGHVDTLAGGDMQKKANQSDFDALEIPAEAGERVTVVREEVAAAPSAPEVDLSGLEAAVAELQEARDALRRDVAAAFEDLEVKRVDIEELRALLEGKADLDALSTLKMHFASLSVGDSGGPVSAGEINGGMMDAFEDALASKADKEFVNVSLDKLWAEVRACQRSAQEAHEDLARLRQEEVRSLQEHATSTDRALEGLEERKADKEAVREKLEQKADLEGHLALKDEVAALKLLLASLRPGTAGESEGDGGMLDALNAAMATKADRTTTDSLADDLKALQEAYMNHLSSVEDEGSHIRLLKAIADLWEALRILQEHVDGLPPPALSAEPTSGSLSADVSMDLLPEWTNRFRTLEDALRTKPEKEELKVVLKELAGVRKKLNEVQSTPRVRVKRVVPRGNKAILSGKPLSGYRCMGCDRPLGKLVQVPGPFVPTNILDNHFKDHTPVHAAGWRASSPKKRAGRGAGGGGGGDADADEDEDDAHRRRGGARNDDLREGEGRALHWETPDRGAVHQNGAGPGGERGGGAMPLTPSNSGLLPQLSPSPTSSPEPEQSDFMLPAQRSYLKKPSTAAARIYQTLPSRAISPTKTQSRGSIGPNLPPGGWHGAGTSPIPTGLGDNVMRPGTSPTLPKTISDKKFPKRSRMKRQKNIASMRQGV